MKRAEIIKTAHLERVNSAIVSADLRLLITISKGSVRLWDVVTGRELAAAANVAADHIVLLLPLPYRKVLCRGRAASA